MLSFSLQTRRRTEMADITPQVEELLHQHPCPRGLCLVYCPHTTAAITINENADPDVLTDLLLGLEILAPRDGAWRHGEGNSDAHIKSSLVGCSRQIIIENGRLVLGTWQSIFFCEFDGPRNRQVHVQIIPAGTD